MLNNIQKAIEKPFQWPSADYLVANADKSHLLTCSKIAIDIHISDSTVSNEKRVKLPRINLESRLNFGFHVDALIKKVSKKCHALTEVSNYMNSNKKCILTNAFIKTLFLC